MTMDLFRTYFFACGAIEVSQNRLDNIFANFETDAERRITRKGEWGWYLFPSLPHHFTPACSRVILPRCWHASIACHACVVGDEFEWY
jgi:hypothetical protein